MRNETQTMTFDTLSAQGTVQLRRGTFGPDIILDGKAVGFIDFFYPPAAERQSPQIVIDDPDGDTPLVRIQFVKGRINVFVKDGSREALHTFHQTASTEVAQ